MITYTLRFFSLGLLLFASAAPAEKKPASPWDTEKLFKAPSITWLDKTSPVRSLTYTGEPFKGAPSQVFAYFASPESLGGNTTKPGEKHPGIVLIHGGGGTAFKAWAELWAKRGYVAIAMDLGGMTPAEADPDKRERLPQGGPDQGHPAKFDTIRTDDLTDDWCYHAVANGILAHSLLLGLPEVDATKTAVTGISWGGYTTCIVASIDHRFKAAVPVYGCGYLWENSGWMAEFAKLGPEFTKKWNALYDPSTYLPLSKVPMFFVNGTNDRFYQLDSYIKSYGAVTSPKNIRLQVKMPHGHEAGWAPKEIGLYIDSLLGVRAEAPLLACTVPVAEEDEVLATVTGGNIKSATMSYALPGTAINTREWKTVPAKVENGIISAPAPPADSDMYFFNVTDERDAMVSSVVVFRKK